MRAQLSTSLVEITSRLVGEHESLTVLSTVTQACVDLLDASATGVLLMDPRGGLNVVAASSERAHFVELLQVQHEQGPCLECMETGQVVEVADLHTETRWPRFSGATVEAGYVAVQAVPMRLDGYRVGGLNLFCAGRTTFSAAATDLAQTLADLAILGLSQEPEPRRGQRLIEHTLTALNSRAHIGQAIGIIAAALELDADNARELFERYGQRQRRSLIDVAQAITSQDLDPAELAATTDGR